jgi:hypothetical protein
MPLPAQEDIKVVFEDPGLEGAIRVAINKPTGDIYVGELKKMKTLKAEFHKIKSLKWIFGWVIIKSTALTRLLVSVP